MTATPRSIPTQTRELLLEITTCPVAQACLDGEHRACTGIVESQGANDQAGFQVPEPWSGQLASAPILFLSSNPSIDSDEAYPTGDWSEDERIDFFEARFDQGRPRPWVDSGMRARMRQGLPPRTGHGTRFWLAVRSRARELMQREPTPGVDYALSEVVHCKSRGQAGVREAFQECADRWLPRLLAVSGARVVVALGTEAAEALHRICGIPHRVPLWGPDDLQGRSRLVVQLPHPNARTRRVSCWPLAHEELARARTFLAER